MRATRKIAYLTVNDPADRRSWSGTQYYMARSLQRHCGDVRPVGPLVPLSLPFRKAARKLLRVFGKEYLYTHTKSFAKETAKMADERLATEDFDLVFAPAASAQIAYLRTHLPIVYLSDTTFASNLNYHPEFRASAVLKPCLRQGEEIEQLAV